MATAVVDFEPAFIPQPLTSEPPDPPAIVEVDPEHENETAQRLHTVRAQPRRLASC